MVPSRHSTGSDGGRQGRVARIATYIAIKKERRLARIAVLEELGVNPTEIERWYLGARRATERLPFEHEFDPQGTVPMSVF